MRLIIAEAQTIVDAALAVAGEPAPGAAAKLQQTEDTAAIAVWQNEGDPN